MAQRRSSKRAFVGQMGLASPYRRVVPALLGGPGVGIQRGGAGPSPPGWWDQAPADVVFRWNPSLEAYGDGDPMPVMTDLGQYGNNGTASGSARMTFAQTGINGLPAAEGDGVNNCVDIALAPYFAGTDLPLLFICTAKLKVIENALQSAYFTVADGPGSVAIHDLYANGLRGSVWSDLYSDSFARLARDLGGDLDTDAHVLALGYTGSSHFLLLNGRLVWDLPTISGPANFTGFVLGSHKRPGGSNDGSFNGFFGDIVIGNVVRPIGEIRACVQAFCSKYGVAYSATPYPWAPWKLVSGSTKYRPACWFRGDAIGSIADNANVPTLYSKTPYGTGYSLVSATEVNFGLGGVVHDAGLNGKRIITLPSANHFFSGAAVAASLSGSAVPYTEWAVFKKTANATRAMLAAWEKSGGFGAITYDFFGTDNAISCDRRNDASSLGHVDAGSSDTSWHSWLKRYDGSVLTIWVDGALIVDHVAQGGGGVSTIDSFFLGGSVQTGDSANISYGDYGVVTDAVSDSEADEFLSYFNDYWNL